MALFQPGTKVTCGTHKVLIDRYLSEGSFGHVYLVEIVNKSHERAVLKRVVVPDKERLATMRNEVETMKRLKGQKNICGFIDSHASALKPAGYEVFLLMEYCDGGGLIDFMNTRLQHRLSEKECLLIFGHCVSGVASMHYLKPPLLHRDIKVENILSKSTGSDGPIYKLCDFGSAAPPRPAAKTVEEGRLIEEDIQKNTTMQYRSPEMIDVWRKQPIDEKADIWALGVLLYKLCYYTTPFEDVGQMAILNASYKFPKSPVFSERLKKLIAWQLKEDPAERPNIYQVLREVCSMRGTEVPIKDIYATRTESEARRMESLPAGEAPSPALIGLQKTAPQVHVQAIPEIAPMRRGRPVSTAEGLVPAKAIPSPGRGDPFAALDSKNYDVRSGAVDELAKRFPSLDEFSIAHDDGNFSFSSGASPKPIAQSAKLNERVTNALADEVFSKPPTKSSAPKLEAKPVFQPRTSSLPQSEPKSTRQAPTTPQPMPKPPSAKYASTGVGSSPPLLAQEPVRVKEKVPAISKSPIWRVPETSPHHVVPQPRASSAAQAAASLLHPSLPPSQRPALLDLHRSKSQTAVLSVVQASSSSRPPLGEQRPSAQDLSGADITRARSFNSRSRPTSMYVDSNIDYLKDQEQSRKRPSMDLRRHSRQASRAREPAPDENAVADDIDFLRLNEESDIARRKSQKQDSMHKKRTSMSAISGAKQMIAGRFGDAFKRFEPAQHVEMTDLAQKPTTPEPRPSNTESKLLSSITGSEATQSRHSDVDSAVDETEDLPPETKHELERRRLSREEQQVADAAAEHRARTAAHGSGSVAAPNKASTIQRRVQSLLDEGRQSPVKRRTAEGYGRYTDTGDVESSPVPQPSVPAIYSSSPPIIQNPAPNLQASRNPYPKTRQQAPETAPLPMPTASASAPAQTAPLQRAIPRPSAPPKPKALRTGGQWPPPPQATEDERPPPQKPAGLAALLAKDLEGVPDYPSSSSSSSRTVQASAHQPASMNELEDFSKRYPSLSGIEMVETEIESGGRRPVRVREV